LSPKAIAGKSTYNAPEEQEVKAREKQLKGLLGKQSPKVKKIVLNESRSTFNATGFSQGSLRWLSASYM